MEKSRKINPKIESFYNSKADSKCPRTDSIIELKIDYILFDGICICI